MKNLNTYKPRHKLSHQTQSKVWPYKNSYLRGFYLIRSRWLKPAGRRFRKYIIVAKNRKWHEARKFVNPAIKKVAKKLIFGKAAYGRPKAYSRRYKFIFYIKQKLRNFHGKIKEDVFRNMFKKHIMRLASQSDSFFVTLESRLDRVFFRIRLLPTVFSCHQYIHYNGLEVNSKLEKSPSSLINVGDMISVPAAGWLPFYANVFKRIYYRRWGRFVNKRRLIKKIKTLFFAYNRSNNTDSKLKSFWLKKAYDISIENQTSFVSKTQNSFKSFKSDNKSHKRVIRKTKHYYINKLQKVKQFFEKTNEYLFYKSSKIISATNKPNFEKNVALDITVNNFAFISDTIKSKLEHLISIKNGVRDIETKQRREIMLEKVRFILAKYSHYQKLYFSNRFYKRKLKKRKWFSKYATQRGFSKNKQKTHKRLKWAFFKINKKNKRKQSIRRLKPVHFYIPGYLQIDFRTLTAIKRKSPSWTDINYPFQISLAKTYTFYKSRGFL